MNNIVKDFLDGIKYLINSALKNASFDSTKDGIILSVNDDNSYNISINDYIYNNIRTINTNTFNVDDVVKVVVPSNQENNIFILGKLR